MQQLQLQPFLYSYICIHIVYTLQVLGIRYHKTCCSHDCPQQEEFFDSEAGVGEKVLSQAALQTFC